MKTLVQNTWYPILRSSRLRKKPITVERLGRRIAVWRTGDSVAAAPAACPHRGADLGAGRVLRNGCLECPWHGIQYASDGRATFRPAEGAEARITDRANLRTLPVCDHKGFIWLWHGAAEPSAPDWFDLPDPPVTVGAEQIWQVHYSRFMESALDFHHVPFVHRSYLPRIGQKMHDVVVDQDGDRIKMTGALATEDGRHRFPAEGEVLMPCTLRITAAGTTFVAAGTPVDEHRTWVAALYYPNFVATVPGLRRLEAAMGMFLDFKLFQRQDRAVFEGLPSGPTDLSDMTPMRADRGTIAWIRTWRQRLEADSTPTDARDGETAEMVGS
ncbi:MAG: Rieske 2Fe-2S domain-containing protein [Stackebrandtia sp.]